ncbi:uncharacterized protein LOC117967555 [Acipenser ruthenus]|uniref:uncharacterized protein LOC117967555 n=1 Tax=Acipenser ruthenus TaxID=7906 RepID=UPI002741DD99|nr:uncharacterized protein LOC117967555 [Acipenser ruthenus]
MSSLSNGDKQRLTYPARHQDRLIQGRFKTTKTTSYDTLGLGTCPVATDEQIRRGHLCHLHPSSTNSKGVRTSRWAAILGDYSKVRELVLGSPRLMEKTTLQLFELNQHTLSQWHNKCQKGQEHAVLQQGVAPPSASAVDPEPQPQPRPLLQEGMTYGHQPHVFSMPPKHRRSGKAAETPWGHGADRSPGPVGHPCATSHFISFHFFSCFQFLQYPIYYFKALSHNCNLPILTQGRRRQTARRGAQWAASPTPGGSELPNPRSAGPPPPRVFYCTTGPIASVGRFSSNTCAIQN